MLMVTKIFCFLLEVPTVQQWGQWIMPIGKQYAEFPLAVSMNSDVYIVIPIDLIYNETNKTESFSAMAWNVAPSNKSKFRVLANGSVELFGAFIIGR